MMMTGQDPAELAAALALPVAARYRESGFAFKTLRSLCGPTSVGNALRSLGEPIERARLFGFRLRGTTLDELAEVVRSSTGRRATVLRDLSLDDFRAELARANEPARRYVVNFDRRPIFGRGGGHHSPVAGYLASADRALVLDTNRRIGPWLVGPERLHAAVMTVDPSTGRRRGLLLVE